MPKHIISVTVECDHDAFTEDEAREFVNEAIGVGTDPHVGRTLNMVALGEFITEDGLDAGTVTTVPVRCYVEGV